MDQLLAALQLGGADGEPVSPRFIISTVAVASMLLVLSAPGESCACFTKYLGQIKLFIILPERRLRVTPAPRLTPRA